MISTLLSERIGIKYPIIQGGMGPYSTNTLCIAVTNAGAGVSELIQRIVREAEEVIEQLPQRVC